MAQVSVTPSNEDWKTTDTESILSATARREFLRPRTLSGYGTQAQSTAQARTNDRLDSWKEIAAYLKKEVRTVQRWEKSSDLPVRRLVHGKQGTVFAYKSELEAWWRESQRELDHEEDRSDAGADPSSSNVVELAFAADLPDKREDNARPARLRPLTLLALLVSPGAAIPPIVFWPQIRNEIWPAVPELILAVRPFKNMSGDPGYDFVGDGLTEEMITWLGRLHPDEMGVIRLSAAYGASDLDRIGKDMHANYVLEGCVRISGQRVAITAQLFRVSNHTLVWAEPYERDLQDVLRIQAEVGNAIAIGVINKLPHGLESRSSMGRDCSD